MSSPVSDARSRISAGLALLALLAGCTSDTETTWEQYNADDNSVEIAVGTTCDPSPCDPVETTLTSNTGSVEVGTARVDPGGGPIGTIHKVEVIVGADYVSDVGRVTVRTDSGDRGADEYDLLKDSTGQGYWVKEIQSVGEEGEERTDTLTFRLYKAVEDTGG